MSRDLSRDEAARLRQERWEHHMHGLCVLDNHLNVQMETAPDRSLVLNNLVEQVWHEFQRKSDDGCVLEDTAVQMAIERHGLQSHDFHQPQSGAKTVSSPVVSYTSSKPPDIECDDVFNQAVSAAIVANGLMTITQKDNCI